MKTTKLVISVAAGAAICLSGCSTDDSVATGPLFSMDGLSSVDGGKLAETDATADVELAKDVGPDQTDSTSSQPDTVQEVQQDVKLEIHKPCEDHDDCKDDDGCTQDYCVLPVKVCAHMPMKCEGNEICIESKLDDGTLTGNCFVPCKTTLDCIKNGDSCHVCENDVCVSTKANEGKPCKHKDSCMLNTTCFYGSCWANNKCDNGDKCMVGECKTNSSGVDACVFSKLCKDDNLCTVDSCDNGNCSYTPKGEKECSDNNPCTFDYCYPQSGCEHKKIKNCCLKDDECDDKNGCTYDSCGSDNVCVHKPNIGCMSCSYNTDCDDGNACTIDNCYKGACSYVPTNQGKSCDDGNFCTLESCDKGVCKYQKMKACDDDNHCTWNFCDEKKKKCVNEDSPWLDKLYCLDESICTDDDCDVTTKKCTHTLKVGKFCSDGNACTQNDHCRKNGFCMGDKIKLNCDDGNSCTSDWCNSMTGKCSHFDGDWLCNDGSACTIKDTCKNGKCQPGKKLICNDKNECTDDSCEAKTGKCLYKANTKPCNDGNPCTVKTKCHAGLCQYGTPSSVCDDKIACTVDLCSWVKGVVDCKYAPVATSCDDANSCTTDVCDPKKGCIHKNTAKDTKCGDGDKCTIKVVCDGKGSCEAEQNGCDDNNPCTDNACNPKTGCVNKPKNGEPCDDGNPCTIKTYCKNGKCGSNASMSAQLISCVPCAKNEDCPTGNFCWPGVTNSSFSFSGACNTKTGKCETKDKFCGGGKPNTKYYCKLKPGGHVFGGAAEGKCVTEVVDPCKGKNCDDGNDCTDDSCNPKTGCVNKPDNSNKCEDGNACTPNDICFNGKCQAGEMLAVCIPCKQNADCPSTEVCLKGFKMSESYSFSGACKASSGICEAKIVSCFDGKLNTKDVCKVKTGGKTYGDGLVEGTCVNEVVDLCKGKSCDDKDPCTFDSCDKKTGKCLHSKKPLCKKCSKKEDCKDTNPCTVEDCDLDDGTCIYPTPDVEGLACDDGNACTFDLCGGSGFGKCMHVKEAGCKACKKDVECDDGKVCTQDKCSKGKCTYFNHIYCEACKSDADCLKGTLFTKCDMQKGRCHKLHNECKKDSDCNDDGNGCTKEVCFSAMAGHARCTSTPIKGCKNCKKSSECDDNNLCTKDTCSINSVTGIGHCVTSKAFTCDDKNPCTADSCNPKNANCVYKPIAGKGPKCDDGKKCTAGDTCQNGKCIGTDIGCCTDHSDCKNSPFGNRCAHDEYSKQLNPSNGIEGGGLCSKCDPYYKVPHPFGCLDMKETCASKVMIAVGDIARPHYQCLK